MALIEVELKGRKIVNRISFGLQTSKPNFQQHLGLLSHQKATNQLK